MQSHPFSPSKFHNPQSSFPTKAALGFNFTRHNQIFAKSIDKNANLQPQIQSSNCSSNRVSVGSKLRYRSKALNEIEKTLNSLKSLGGDFLSLDEQTAILHEQGRRWQRVVRIFEWFNSQKEYVPNVIHYNVVIQVLGRAQRWDELRLCLMEMEEKGVLPNSHTYSMVVKVYQKAGRVEEALLWIKQMKRRGMFPDEVKLNGDVFILILRYLRWQDDVEKALELVGENLSPKEQMVILGEQKWKWERVLRIFEWFKLQEEYVPDVMHYNSVINVLGRARRWDELRHYLIEMEEKGVQPDNFMYSSLVFACGKAGLVKEALLLIKNMTLRGMFPDEVTMTTVVSVLKNEEEFDMADKFYKDWCTGRIEIDDHSLDSMGDSVSVPISFKRFLSTELFKTVGRIPASKLTSVDTEDCIQKPQLTSTYNNLIDLYGKAGRLSDAANVFREMMKSGVAMDTITFNTMIFTCGSHGHLLEAEALLDKMKEKGISPDTTIYNTFLSLYAHAGNSNAALNCYKKIREVGLYPDVVSYKTILHVLCKSNRVLDVVTVIEDMEKSGVSVDSSVSGVIKMYINERQLDHAKLLYKKFQLTRAISSKKGVSSKKWAAIIDSYADDGLWIEAEKIFFRKGEGDLVGQSKDIMEYNVMIKAYGKAKLYDKAFSLFKGMKNHGIWPNDSTYNSLIQMLSGDDLVDQARDLLSEMEEAGLKVQFNTVSALIGCYARLGQLSEAVDLYQYLVKSGEKPNEFVYGSLINGCAELARPEEALKYIRIMEECGISANQVILTSLIKAYGKAGFLDEAERLYERLKDFDGGPDVAASNSMINLYARLGMVYEGKSIFEELRSKGWADEITFGTMMFLYKSMGMLDETFDVAEEMKQSGLIGECASFNQVMSIYAIYGKLRECGELLHEMVTQEVLLDSGTCNILFTVLKKGRMPVEAVTQLELSYQEGRPYTRRAIITSVFSVVGMHDIALKYCEKITKANINLDPCIYNVAIYAYGAAGAIDDALKIVMRMQDADVKPDLVTHINLVGCYGKAGMVEGVNRIYRQLKYEEIEPSHSLFRAVTNAYRNANRPDLAKMVRQQRKYAFDSGRESDFQTTDEFDDTGSDLEDNPLCLK